MRLLTCLIFTAALGAASIAPPMLGTSSVQAQARVVSPPAGSALRAAVLNGLRPAVERDLGAPVEFVVSSIRVDQRAGTAFVQVNAQRPGGRPIDLARTPLAQTQPLDLIDGTRTEAFMRLRNGRWSVDAHAVGATDMWYADPARCGVYRSVLPSGMCR